MEESTNTINQHLRIAPETTVGGEGKPSPSFEWKSWKCLYSIGSILGQLFVTIMCVVRLIKSETSFDTATPIIFYGTTCLTMVMLFKISHKWPKLAKHVVEQELADESDDRRVVYKCNITCAIVLFSALVEHLLSLQSFIIEGKKCTTDYMSYESFVKSYYHWMFNYLEYSIYLAMFTQLIHIQSIFIWNFSGLFIVCLSFYLTSRLDHVNNKLRKMKGKYLPESSWRKIRQDYCRVADVVRRVDDIINGITFICFANNLYFVCLQLFYSLENGFKGVSRCSRSNSTDINATLLESYGQAIYLIFSLVYLLSRSVAVSVLAAEVHTTSLVPAPLLYAVPSPVFCTDVQRFIDQVNSANVALTGLQFFTVTKELLLNVASTIITYELVMVQFKVPSTQVASATAIPFLNITGSISS